MAETPSYRMQLKRYRILPGSWDEYLPVWRAIAGIRTRCGFYIRFACIDHEANMFTWAIDHAEFDRGAERYYADLERKRFSRTEYDPITKTYSDDPARRTQRNIEDYILDADIVFVDAVSLP